MTNQNRMYYFIGILLFQVLLHYIIGMIFDGNLYLIIMGEIIFNVIIAFLFAYINYRGYRNMMWRDPNFHKAFGIYFLIFLALDVILFFM